MKKLNPTILVLMLIMLINALSYGTIIPLLYPYASRFGLDPRGLSFLFASFSLAQFISTPILGRLSDRFGRKPVLFICLLGSTISLGLFAAAKTIAVLYIARIIDGITGGNISVAQAVIADTTDEKDRARIFGLLGASFGFGFIFGPALGALMSDISITAPFWFSAGLALVATICSAIFLKESLPPVHRQSTKKPLFAVHSLLTSLFKPLTGIVFVISLLTSIAFNGWIIGFQTFTVDIIKLSARNIGFLFATVGIINVLMQAIGIRLLSIKLRSNEKLLAISVILGAIVMTSFSLIDSFIPFVIACGVLSLVTAPQGVVVGVVLSERTNEEDQGGVLGLNQSYTSLGQIVGPLVAGMMTVYHVHWAFFTMGMLSFIAAICSKWLFVPTKEKLDL